jgi:peptidoglycan/xylan/chitin deacetylase (PgdA/CDA1 family)
MLTQPSSARRKGFRHRRGRGLLISAVGVLLAFTITACTSTDNSHARQFDSGVTGGREESPSPGPTPTSTTGPVVLPANLRARLPVFGPPPLAIPIKVPNGPDAGWYASIPTSQPVAFLTIDDGFTKNPELVDLLRASHIRVTLFLEINAIKDNPEYFRQLENAGAVIEDHTVTHAELRGTSYEYQRNEICGGADRLATYYGHRPVLFRPPFGDKDDTTLRVVHDCGMKAAFFWKETVDAGIVRYQSGNKIRAGDIILMHFRPAVLDDFLAALNAIHNAGLTPALLEDYIATDATQTIPNAPSPTPSPTP